MPKAVDMMKRREQEIRAALLHLSERTEGFTNPRIAVIGGYALRAYIPLSRFTRDCEFVLTKKNGWTMDDLKAMLPQGYLIKEEEKLGSYGFLRCAKRLRMGRAETKISMDFMEGEIRGRSPSDIIVIDEALMERRKTVAIPLAGEPIRIAVPDYIDYFIMKVVSSRASDIRDVTSLVSENGIPTGLEKRITQILPHAEVFKAKLVQKVLPELEKPTFISSWRGIFGTSKYSESDKQKVTALIKKLVQQF